MRIPIIEYLFTCYRIIFWKQIILVWSKTLYLKLVPEEYQIENILVPSRRISSFPLTCFNISQSFRELHLIPSPVIAHFCTTAKLLDSCLSSVPPFSLFSSKIGNVYKKISERVQKYYIPPDYSHVELIFRVLNWSWKDHSDLTVYGWRYKGTHLHLFLKAFIELCYVWKFSFHTCIQLHMFIFSITRTCKPKRR